MKKNSYRFIAAIAMVCLTVFISGCSNRQAAFKKRIETELAVPVAKLVAVAQSPKGKELTERITKTGAAMKEVEKAYAAALKEKAGADKLDPLVSKYAALLKDSFVDARELYNLEKDGIEGLKKVLGPMAKESMRDLEANKDVIEATMKPFAEVNEPLMVVLQRTEFAFLFAGRTDLDQLSDKKLEEFASSVLAQFAE